MRANVRSSYAASYELAPRRMTWGIYREMQDGGIARIDEPTKWLKEQSIAWSPPNTVRTKATALSVWWRWCTDTGVDPLRARADDMSSFILALQTVPKDLPLSGDIHALPGNSRLREPSTINQMVNNIKQFYKWAYERKIVTKTTLQQIGNYKAPRATQKKSAPRLYADELAALFSSLMQPRDRLAVELLYGAGLREGEALGLRIEDMHLSSDLARLFDCNVFDAGPHLHVVKRLNPNGATAKSVYSRTVPLSARVLIAYSDWQAYLFENMPEGADCGYVLLSLKGATRGRPWSVSGFLSMWRRHIKSIPALAESYPHILRHTFASELVDAGVESFRVQELLGHRHPASTEIYTHAHAATMAAAVDRLNRWRESTLAGSFV